MIDIHLGNPTEISYTQKNLVYSSTSLINLEIFFDSSQEGPALLHYMTCFKTRNSS